MKNTNTTNNDYDQGPNETPATLLMALRLFTVLSLLLLLLAGCGAGDPSASAKLPSGTNTSTQPLLPPPKIYPCDASIVAIMATFEEPYLMGLGAPDTTTYITSGQMHTIIYQFNIPRQRITLEYNTSGQCRETVETF